MDRPLIRQALSVAVSILNIEVIMTKITKYIILIFLLALQVVYLIEIIERVSLNKWSDIFFPCIFSLSIWNAFYFFLKKVK